MIQQINQDDIPVKFIKKKHSSKDLRKIPCSGDKGKPVFKGLQGTDYEANFVQVFGMQKAAAAADHLFSSK
jgi:hypothetical protein